MSHSILIHLTCLLALSIGSAALAQTSERVEVDIPAQPVGDALNLFAEQSGLQVVLYADEADGIETKPVAGEFDDVEIALDTLLASTGLEYEFINDRTVAVNAVGQDEGGSEPGKSQPASSPVLMAQNQTSAEQNQTTIDKDQDETQSEEIILEEIIVTGSHIRGAQSASPTLSFDRLDIELSGHSTTEGFLRTVPQNFSGGLTEAFGGISGSVSSRGNPASAQSANLRGMGTVATLTLLNGRRVAPIGTGDGVDLSMIPLEAVERIDVLSDGASAIYGSDAISGVVNIVLRDDLDGAETRLRYGTVTEGSSADFLFSQAFGNSWQTGNALFTYTYKQRDPLSAEDRSFTATAVQPGQVFGESERHGAFFTLKQALSEETDFYVDANFNDRKSDNQSTVFGRSSRSDYSVTQYGASLGMRSSFGESWQSDTGVLVSKTDNSTDSFTDGVFNRTTDFEVDILSFDAKFDGTLFQASGGAAKLAFGGQYRQEELSTTRGAAAGARNAPDRNVSAVFTELYVPLVGETNAQSGIRRLELSIAGRHDNYSDFGETSNGKVGLLWSPVKSLNLRSTWGTSFRAPLLYEVNEDIVANNPFTFSLPDDSVVVGGSTPTMIIAGNNADLQPEEATTWSLGFDLQPEGLPGFNFSLTYYDIDYTDRILEGIANADFFNVFVKEDIYASQITRRPDPSDLEATAAFQALIDFYFAFPTFGDFAGVPASEVNALADFRLTNLASTEQSGLDFDLGYSFDTGIGDFSLGLSGTHILDQSAQVTSISPVDDTQLNSAYSPADLKLRGSIAWSRNDLSVATFINYVDSYEEKRPGIEGNIDSWTSVDMNIRYAFEGRSSTALNGTVVSLNILNLFDEDPPFVFNRHGYNYDATNADALGRFVAIDFRKHW